MEEEKTENVWFKDNENWDTMDIAKTGSKALRQMDHFLTVLEVNNEDKLLLGAASVGGRFSSGSLWLFNAPEKAPFGRSLACIELDIGASDAKFYDDTIVIYSDYSGVVSYLNVKYAAEDGPVYFTRESCFTGQDGYISTLDTSLSNGRFITGSSDCSIFVWDVAMQTPVKRYPAHKNGVTGLSYKPNDGEMFVSCSADGSSLLWDTRKDKPASSIAVADVGVSSIEWLDENRVILGDLSGFVQLCDIRSLATSNRLQLSTTHPVKRIRVNKGKNSVAVAVNKPVLHILSTEGDTLKSVYESVEHKGLISGISWSKMTGQLHSCGYDDRKVLHHYDPS